MNWIPVTDKQKPLSHEFVLVWIVEEPADGSSQHWEPARYSSWGNHFMVNGHINFRVTHWSRVEKPTS